jgi:delta-aminolevulinic acid dehydratase/porphobilinogen synthase
MLYHGSKAGAFSLKDSVLETLQCMRRAGKSYTCTILYFTNIIGTLIPLI